jgi:hypothetical protein
MISAMASSGADVGCCDEPRILPVLAIPPCPELEIHHRRLAKVLNKNQVRIVLEGIEN